MTAMIKTEIPIVGSGPADSASTLAPSISGVPNVLVTKYGWLANTPRAHITNQRTFEVPRHLGVEAEAKALLAAGSSGLARGVLRSRQGLGLVVANCNHPGLGLQSSAPCPR